MNHSKFITQNSKFAGGGNLKDWRGPDTARHDSANLETAGNPQVVSEAKDKLVHDGRWNGQLCFTIQRLFTQLKGRGTIDNSSSRTFNNLN